MIVNRLGSAPNSFIPASTAAQSAAASSALTIFAVFQSKKLRVQVLRKEAHQYCTGEHAWARQYQRLAENHAEKVKKVREDHRHRGQKAAA